MELWPITYLCRWRNKCIHRIQRCEWFDICSHPFLDKFLAREIHCRRHICWNQRKSCPHRNWIYAWHWEDSESHHVWISNWFGRFEANWLKFAEIEIEIGFSKLINNLKLILLTISSNIVKLSWIWTSSCWKFRKSFSNSLCDSIDADMLGKIMQHKKMCF